MIDYNLHTNTTFYETETNKALDWLYRIRDEQKHGWAWVQFIQPNEQNTAEVIHTFAENEEWLCANEEKLPQLVESIEYWLFDTSHPTLSIDYCWVIKALQKIRRCELLYSRIDPAKLRASLERCMDWLLANYRKDEDGCGWSDNSTEILNVIRTSLAILCLNEELAYWREQGGAPDREKELADAADGASRWLKSIQNTDGGWGNLGAKEIDQNYQREHQFSYEDLRYQSDSNPASTGYVMLALGTCLNSRKYEYEIKRGYQYLVRAQSEDGGWPVFTEMGVRNGERYTFRHFSTAWALQGIIRSGCGNFRDECIIHGFEYLSNLQDDNYGGWKSSPDADNYTWATCNALSTIDLLKEDLAAVRADHFLDIVWDWWELKKRDANYDLKIGHHNFAFNAPMALAFCLVFSVMITMLMGLSVFYINTVIPEADVNIRKLIFSIITVICALVLGLPWIVYVYNRFRKEVGSLINSIGWVYGIITGFVLVLYQFFI